MSSNIEKYQGSEELLEKLVKDTPWIHRDLMAWTRANKFSSYEGAQDTHTLAHPEIL